MKKQRAFTLMEVLVAMAMIAIALPVLLQSIAVDIRRATELKETTFAHWVAMNVITELQATRSWPSPGENTGTETMVNQQWHWKAIITQTPEKDMRKVVVEVRLRKDQKNTNGKIEGYLAKP